MGVCCIVKNKQNFVVLASEPVGGRSQATELPCFKYDACKITI